MSGCRCWEYDAALGHEGHCCFIKDDRTLRGRERWRNDADICHVPTQEVSQ